MDTLNLYGNLEFPEDSRDDIEIVEPEWEESDALCEVCMHELKRAGYQNGPDDFEWVYLCEHCGETYTP